MKRKEKILKLDLIEKISDEVGIPRSKAEKCLDVIKSIFKEAAIEDKRIVVKGFFQLEPYKTKKRKIQIPKTKEIIEIEPKKRVKVRFADSFLKEINNN